MPATSPTTTNARVSAVGTMPPSRRAPAWSECIKPRAKVTLEARELTVKAVRDGLDSWQQSKSLGTGQHVTFRFGR